MIQFILIPRCTHYYCSTTVRSMSASVTMKISSRCGAHKGGLSKLPTLSGSSPHVQAYPCGGLYRDPNAWLVDSLGANGAETVITNQRDETFK